MKIKKVILALTICICLSQAAIAKKEKNSIWNAMVQMKNSTVSFAKKHPVAIATAIIVVTNKTLREKLSLENIQENMQDHPLWAVITIALSINYAFNCFDLETR